MSKILTIMGAVAFLIVVTTVCVMGVHTMRDHPADADRGRIEQARQLARDVQAAQEARADYCRQLDPDTAFNC